MYVLVFTSYYGRLYLILFVYANAKLCTEMEMIIGATYISNPIEVDTKFVVYLSAMRHECPKFIY